MPRFIVEDDFWSLFPQANVEKWADAAAVAAHNASAHFQAFIKQAPAFVSAPMEVEVFAGEPVKL